MIRTAKQTTQRMMQPFRVRYSFRQGLLALCIGIAGVAPVMAAPLLPALVDPASGEHHPGKVIFVELVTPDLAAAKAFYAGLFGWTFRDVQGDGVVYAEASLDGHLVAAMFYRPIKPTEHRQPAWLTFISAANVDVRTKTSVEHGAKVLFEPHDVPNLGREAVLADPQGAVFAVLASSSGDPPDVLPEPGEWIWSSLIARDPDADAAFYQALFDYEVFELPTEADAEHLILSSDGYARASVNSLPANGANPHPYWLNFVRVEDAVATAKKVVSLGGRVLVEPRVDRHGGMVAVVADPLGAPFGLLEWTGTQSKGTSK